MSDQATESTYQKLYRILKIAPQSEQSEGIYDPVKNMRVLYLTGNHETRQNRMVSLHETFHAFLNQSTSYGNAMLLVAQLIHSGFEEFYELLKELVDQVLEPHEIYATTLGLYVANEGHFDPTPLTMYPEYLKRLNRFKAVSNLERPGVASLIFGCAVRAAMQTGILSRWGALPCQEWSMEKESDRGNPARRLELLLDRDLFERASEVLESEVTRRKSPFEALFTSTLSPSEQMHLTRKASDDDMEITLQVIFSVFSEALEQAGYGSTDDGRNRRDAPRAVERINAYTEGKQSRKIHVLQSAGEDYSAILSDIRHEVLVIRPEPDFAVAGDLRKISDKDLRTFLLGDGGVPYLQLVAMPLTKARQLYRSIDGHPLFPQQTSSHLVALRSRAIVPSLNNNYVIQFLYVDDPNVLDSRIEQIQSHQNLLPIISLSTINDLLWRQQWLIDDSTRALEIATVLIDQDPFALLESLSRSSAEVKFHYIKARIPDKDSDQVISVLVVTPGRDYSVVYFCPCSIAVVGSIYTWAERHLPNVTYEKNMEERFELSITRSIGHVIHEQHAFDFLSNLAPD